MNRKSSRRLFAISTALSELSCSAIAFCICTYFCTFVFAETRPASVATNESVIDSVDHDYSAELPRIAPTELKQAIGTFVTEPGFQIELAAAEQQVAGPVAMEFDENGRLFVVEMRGYSEDGDKNLGTIRLLEDTDQDGRFETSTIYADGLSWPTALTCYDGGVFVGAAPEILYLKDTDGNNKADVRRTVFTGLGRSNVQGLMNSFRWGLDNRIHVAVSSSGAELKRADEPTEKPLVLRGRDFAFNPGTLSFQATSGGGQHGMSFNRWGTKFVCSNSNHIQQIFYEDRYLARNPLVHYPPVRKSIAADGPAAEVYRISPVEPWRIVRTRLRMKKIVPGVVEGGGRAAGYFTGATGATIYTGDSWPEEYLGNAFIGDAGGNLVHRKRLDADGITYIARRVTPNSEFVASKDIWFRPVQFSNGPDGNLYITDMYREVIEHPLSLPPMIKKHLDLTSGRERGRIYRVVWDSRANRPAASSAAPGDASTAKLVELLNHTNGWHRRTASRLLFQRQDSQAVPVLESLSRTASSPEGRMHALYALAGMNALRSEIVAARYSDSHPRVREHAIRLSEGIVDDTTVAGTTVAWKQLLELATDPDQRVRYQLAWTLGEFDNSSRIPALCKLARTDADNPYLCAAIYSSLSHDSEKVFHELLADEEFLQSTRGQSFLIELARQIGSRGNELELAAVASDLTTLHDVDQPVAVRLIVSMMQGAGARASSVRKQLANATSGQTEQLLASFLQSAKKTVANEDASVDARSQAIESLTLGTFHDTEPILAQLLEPQQPRALQLAALSTLSKFTDANAASIILGAWNQLSPTIRREASVVLLSRGQWTKLLVDAIEDGQLQANDVDLETFQRLASNQSTDIRQRAKQLMQSRTKRKSSEVVEAYRKALELPGDFERGRDVFRKHCAICHQREGFGTSVGPALETVINRGPEAMLISILDPNREVDPKYLQYIVLTASGRSLAGIITAETAAGVTLTRGENKSETITRADIEELQSTGTSLMPDGFEKEITQQAMADLLVYLRTAK